MIYNRLFEAVLLFIIGSGFGAAFAREQTMAATFTAALFTVYVMIVALKAKQIQDDINRAAVDFDRIIQETLDKNERRNY